MSFARLCRLLMLGCAMAWLALPARAQPAGQDLATAQAAPLLLAQAFWWDETGQARLQEAQRQSYTPYQGVFNRGYAEGVHWIRLTMAASGKPMGLRVLPAWLDEVTLYDPAQPGSVTVGDKQPADPRSLHALSFAFRLPATEQPRDVWLRLKSTSAHRMVIEALPLDELPKAQAHDLMWAALYGAVLLLMLFILLAAWAIQPDRVLGFFLLRHAVFSVFAIAYLGLPTLVLSDRLPPVFFDGLFSLFTILAFPVGLAFDLALLSVYGPPRWMLRLLKVGIGVGCGVLVLLLLGHERLALQLNVQVMIAVVLMLFVTALSCRPDASVEGLMPKKIMLVYYTLILGGLVIGLVSIQGWIRSTNVTLHILILHGLVSGLVMTGILFVRAQRQQQQAGQMRWQLRKAQQDVLEQQRRREEQSQFLHMLMHELKTPLAVVSLALGTRENRENNLQMAGEAVQQMKAVIERCVRADQLAGVAAPVWREPMDMAELARQVAQAMPELGPRLRWDLKRTAQVHTDRQLLQVILGNLLENALRYSDPTSPIDVEVKPCQDGERDGVLLSVRNTPGLAGWPDSAQLFGKYYRSVGAQRESGTGLGLFLSRQLAHTLQGQLRYLPTDHQVQFNLWIPCNPS